MAHIANMQRDVTGTPGRSRPKPLNHAGLFLVVSNESPHSSHPLQQSAIEAIQRYVCWTALGTLLVEELCLLAK